MTIGVLVMAYGTPRDRDDIETYYTDIRRGRPPTPELLADLTGRYDALGGTFPLREITDRQVAALAAALGEAYTVVLGTKHSVPKIEDAVAELASRGVERIVGLVLAPHYSRFSIGEYAERAAKAGADYELVVDTLPSWHLLPAYVSFLERAAAGAAGLVVSACGFVADHLEVAYDLDVEAAALARELGLPFARTASVNDDTSVMTALAELVAQR